MSYKIPNSNNKYYVSNASDLIPNIQYTKNIIMDEEGYLKLAPTFNVVASEAGVAPITNFGIIADVFKYGGDTDRNYKVITDNKIFTFDSSDLTTTLDAGAPSGDMESRWAGWKGGTYDSRAYVETASDIWSFESSTGTFPATTTWAKENTDSGEYTETFVNRNTLCVSTSSTIQQYLTTDMNATTPPATNSGQTLTIPSNFNITGMAYSNYRMGIATIAKGIGSAYFFTWDGSTADAQQGFPVNAKMIYDLVAYKNSWVLLTDEGQLLFFNGSGFDVLGNLPVYFSDDSWKSYSNSSESHGRMMMVEGDLIYFNIGSMLDISADRSGLLKGFYSGIWCYDPDIGGVYHRYGVSHSQVIRDDSSNTNGVYTYVNHLLETGDKIKFYSYDIKYVIKLTADTFKIADTYDLAIAGTATSTPIDGTKFWIARTDWTQLAYYNNNIGACIKFNDYYAYRQGLSMFFVGAGMQDKTLAYTNYMNILATGFDSIGSICYAKQKSENYEDAWESINVKYKKLSENDKIIVKYKIKDNYKQLAIGDSGDAAPDYYVSWTNSTTFTVPNATKNLSNVEVGDEVEFFQGAGAGSTAHVVSCTLASTTWTVVLDESIRGAASGNKSTCIFDSFKKLNTITKTNTSNLTNQTRITLNKNNKSSKWIQVKLELRGNDIAIEEVSLNNKIIKPII